MSRSDGILFIRILKNALAVLKKLTTLFSIRVVTHFHTTYIMLPTPRVILSPSMNSHQQLVVGGGELPDVGLVGRGVARASPRAVPRGEAAHVHCAWGSEGSRAGDKEGRDRAEEGRQEDSRFGRWVVAPVGPAADQGAGAARDPEERGLIGGKKAHTMKTTKQKCEFHVDENL